MVIKEALTTRAIQLSLRDRPSLKLAGQTQRDSDENANKVIYVLNPDILEIGLLSANRDTRTIAKGFYKHTPAMPLTQDFLIHPDEALFFETKEILELYVNRAGEVFDLKSIKIKNIAIDITNEFGEYNLHLPNWRQVYKIVSAAVEKFESVENVYLVRSRKEYDDYSDYSQILTLGPTLTGEFASYFANRHGITLLPATPPPAAAPIGTLSGAQVTPPLAGTPGFPLPLFAAVYMATNPIVPAPAVAAPNALATIMNAPRRRRRNQRRQRSARSPPQAPSYPAVGHAAFYGSSIAGPSTPQTPDTSHYNDDQTIPFRGQGGFLDSMYESEDFSFNGRLAPVQSIEDTLFGQFMFGGGAAGAYTNLGATAAAEREMDEEEEGDDAEVEEDNGERVVIKDLKMPRFVVLGGKRFGKMFTK